MGRSRGSVTGCGRGWTGTSRRLQLCWVMVLRCSKWTWQARGAAASWQSSCRLASADRYWAAGLLPSGHQLGFPGCRCWPAVGSEQQLSRTLTWHWCSFRYARAVTTVE